jgi:hypothetical protein
VNVAPAVETRRDPRRELALERGLDAEQLDPKRLGGDRERVVGRVAGDEHLVDQNVGRDGLLGDRRDGLLEGVSLAETGHRRRIGQGSDGMTLTVGAGPSPDASASGSPVLVFERLDLRPQSGSRSGVEKSVHSPP